MKTIQNHENRENNAKQWKIMKNNEKQCKTMKTMGNLFGGLGNADSSIPRTLLSPDNCAEDISKASL